MCFILRLPPCFVATARAVLLSALACIRNYSPISFSFACAKINSADSAPTMHTVLILRQTRQQFPFARQEKLINTRCALLRHLVASPVSIRVSRDVSSSCSGRSVSRQVSSGRDSVHVFLSNISTISWHVSNVQVLCKFVKQTFCHEHQVRSHSGYEM